MSGAPASAHAERREDIAALCEVYAYLRALAREAPANDPPSALDSAGSARPLRAGVQSEQHNIRALPTKGGADVEEDDHRDGLTTIDNGF